MAGFGSEVSLRQAKAALPAADQAGCTLGFALRTNAISISKKTSAMAASTAR